MPFPSVLVQSETQPRPGFELVVNSISYDNNHYAKCASVFFPFFEVALKSYSQSADIYEAILLFTFYNFLSLSKSFYRKINFKQLMWIMVLKENHY